MDSSQYNPTYDPWDSPYSSHLHPPSAPLLPSPPPLPPPPRQSHPNTSNFYARSTQSDGQRQDYHHQYSHHRQNLPPNLAVDQPSLYYSQHPPPLQQQNQPQLLQQQHPQYIPQQVSYEPQRISQPLSSSIQYAESRDIAPSDWVGFNEKIHDSWTVDAGKNRIDSGRIRVDDGPDLNFQYDYSRSSRDSSGVSRNRALDGTSRSRDEFRSLGYVKKESGATRIEGNFQDRGQLKSESDRYFRGLDEGNRVLSPSVGYGSERHDVSIPVSRNMNRSSASHEARNQRWDKACNERTLYPRKKNDYYHSDIEQHFDRGRREESKKLNQTPRKQMQKKSALLRLETPRSYQNSRVNYWSRQHNHHNGKRFNSFSYRGKEHLGHSDRGLVEKQRGRTPLDFDVSLKSNILVSKPIASPTNVGIRLCASVTPRSSKARRALLSDKNEKASLLTEGNGKLRTHFSFEASLSESFRQSTRQTTASETEKEPDKHSMSSSDSGGKLNKVRFEGVVQDSKVKISDTDPKASTHDSEIKIRSIVHAAEKISNCCKTLKKAKDDINAKHDNTMEACSSEADVFDVNQSIQKSHKVVLDRTSTSCNAGKALMSKVMEKDESMKTKKKIIISPVKLPAASLTAADLSGCSEGGIHFTGKPIFSVGSQHCEDEDMDYIPSRNLPMMEVNSGYKERNFNGSSDGFLGYGGKDFQKTSLDVSIYSNREDTGNQVLAKSDIGVIEDDNRRINKNVDSLSHEHDSSRGLHMGLVSPASLEISNVSMDLANANNSASGDLANANSFTTGTYINTMVKSSDMSVVLQMESKNLSHCEMTGNPSVENVSRKEYTETTPLNITAETVDNMNSDEGKQTCVNSTSSLTEFVVKGSSSVPVEKTDDCSHGDESDLAMAVPSEVCMENVSIERPVLDEDLVLKSHHPPEISSVNQFSGPSSRVLKACLSEPNVSLSKDFTDCESGILVERDVSQSAATFCDKLPSLSAFETETNLAIESNGILGNETVSLQEIQLCTRCRSSGEVGSVRNLSTDNNLEKDPSKVNSYLVSDSSVSPSHISPLVVVNEHIQNKTSIQANYSDSHGAIVHKEIDCAESIEVDSQEEKAKPSGGDPKYRTPVTIFFSSSGDSVLSCNSLSSSPKRNFRQIQSEVHIAAMVDANSKGKEKPKPSGGTSKYRTPGTDTVTVRRDSVFPCDSIHISPRPYRRIRNEIHVASIVDDTSKSKEKTDPSGETTKHRTMGTDIIAGRKDSVFPSNSLSSSPRLRFRQLRSEIHVAAVVDDTNKCEESQKGDSLLDSLQEQIMTSHEVTQRGSSLTHFDVGMKPIGDPIEKLNDITSNVGTQENDSLRSAKTGISDGEEMPSGERFSGTKIPGDLDVPVSRSYSHPDVKFASDHFKDHVVSMPNRDPQNQTSMSSKYGIEKRKKKSNYSTQKSYPSSPSFVADTMKDANPPIHITKRHTWHRKSDTSPSSFVAAKSLSSTSPTAQMFPKVTAQSSSGYVRKRNSLLRKPSLGSPCVSLGRPPSASQLNPFTVEDKSMGLSSMVNVDNTSSLVKNGNILTLERQAKPPSDSSTSKVSNAIATSSGKRALSYSMDHLTTGLPESIMDSATSGEVNVSHSGGDTFKTSDTLIQTGYASDCQQKRNLANLDSSNLKREVYVKRKANQIPPSDGYFKPSKNQLVRNSESCVNQPISLSDDALDTQTAANMVSERSSSSAFSDSAVMRPFKQSKFSLVWTQNDPQSRMPIAHMRYQKILPQLVPWKRVTYWRRLMNSVATNRNGSFSNISQKLSMMRKRHTLYTRSTNGYSLRKSKVLSIGGSHLKWSKSIERDSRKANEEATLAVAAFSKKENEKHSGQNNTRTTSRNHLARERVFRFGSLRYKMDSSRRTLQRISDVDSPFSGSSNGKDVKRPFIPKRLVIGNEEYVRVGNGNQLVRDPKKRTRVLANEKVRWSLHNARLRLAKKNKYCQFFTRFGKCNKDDGKCPYVHDPSKIAVCTKFLNGLCANANCKLTHKVIPERMPDCFYFLQGLCNNEACPYRHVHVNPSATICDGFLKGYCSDGDECRKKHSYICPVFEATGSCSQRSKCKLHHPKLQSKGRKRKRPSEPSQKNARGRYFGSLHNVLFESEPMVIDRRSTDSELFRMEGLGFVIPGITGYEAGYNNDPPIEESTSRRDSESLISIYNLIRPVALMQ